MAGKSLVNEARQTQLAIDLIQHGARLQLLEAETTLSRERLLKLYKEVRGVSPPKGMLPFSTDWFISWQPNIHASLFIDTFKYLHAHADVRGVEATLKAFKLYLEHCQAHQLEPVLSLTRAWSLVRFFDAKLLQTAPCTRCGGQFVVHSLDLYNNFVCGLCRVPSRAGKTKKAADQARMALLQQAAA
ncbi:MAG: flagellar transcriptional regulator FlhC [Betaproteobacteria bacterium]|nr:flagellar transcriptional regulator FlhC [Betaproteobacteria bacterium]